MYDMLVIGAGPAGQKAALQAAKLRKRVAIIEREPQVGGTCVSTGTLPSKTLRETVHSLSTLRKHHVGMERRTTMRQLLDRKEMVIDHEIDIIRGQLSRNEVDVINGQATFVDAHTVKVVTRDGMSKPYQAERFVIATGSRPTAPRGVELDGQRLLDSDTILALKDVPRSLVVLGGGVIGCEYACIFAALGTKVTLIDRRTRLLRFMDAEITDALVYHMRASDITLRLGEELENIRLTPRPCRGCSQERKSPPRASDCSAQWAAPPMWKVWDWSRSASRAPRPGC